MHGPCPIWVCSLSKRSADASEAAMKCGAVPAEIRVTPAALTGSTSTIRSTSRSRIPWIGKSVTIVRANSASTADNFSW